MDQGTLRKTIKRLERLENAVFGPRKKQIEDAKERRFTGPSGGVRLLISKNFFNTKRILGDVKKALAKVDYHYGSAQIQTAPNRLSTRKGPLASSTEGGKKSYVKRK
jgi:hypothetical protein